MKCLSCGSSNPAAATFCEYCGSSLKDRSSAKTTGMRHQAASASPSNEGENPSLDGLWPSVNDPIFSLLRMPNGSPFRWMAFLVPVAYLAGYRAERAAIGLAMMLLATYVLTAVLGLVNEKAADILLFAMVIFYSVKAGFCADRFTRREGGFQWGPAIGFQLIYLVLSVATVAILE